MHMRTASHAGTLGALGGVLARDSLLTATSAAQDLDELVEAVQQVRACADHDTHLTRVYMWGTGRIAHRRFHTVHAAAVSLQ